METYSSNSANPSAFDSNIFSNALAIALANIPPPKPVAITPPIPKPAAPIDCKIATRLPAATVPRCNDISHAATDPAAIPASPNPNAPTTPPITTGPRIKPVIVAAVVIKIFLCLITKSFARSPKFCGGGGRRGEFMNPSFMKESRMMPLKMFATEMSDRLAIFCYILPKDDLNDYINYENSEDNVELELQNIMNEQYKEYITTEDYINCNNTYEIEAMPGLSLLF
ncbi:6982_t:CDS:2 [Entrophospora sp. SA101]|nr:6982_t:CDS:2 [Entrophospora sp. SA101]